jgi:phosphatidylserine decarboxylase
MMDWTPVAGKPAYKVAFVSVGAMLVGSNRFTGAEKGKSYERGTEMGYFAYGVRITLFLLYFT